MPLDMDWSDAMSITAPAQPAITSQGQMLLQMKAAADQFNRTLNIIDPLAGDEEALGRLKIACMAYCADCPLSVCRFD